MNAYTFQKSCMSEYTSLMMRSNMKKEKKITHSVDINTYNVIYMTK